MKKKLKNKENIKQIKNTKNDNISISRTKHLFSTIIITILFIVMLFTFYQNITLKLKRNELNSYVEEYQLLKEEIDSLKEMKENYEIILKNNEQLESEKQELEHKIDELNKEITNLNNKIDKLK